MLTSHDFTIGEKLLAINLVRWAAARGGPFVFTLALSESQLDEEFDDLFKFDSTDDVRALLGGGFCAHGGD